MPIVTMAVAFGVKEIDEYHLHLVQLLNRTYDDFREGTYLSRHAIDELIRYAASRLAWEERKMTSISYPGLAEHKSEHDFFTASILQIQTKYKHDANSSVETIWLLCNWITHHIREADAGLAGFIDIQHASEVQGAQGIQPVAG